MTLQKYDGREGTGTFRKMTLAEAKSLQYGEHIWFHSIQGDARRAKVNGKPKTWKRKPDVEVPIKYGLYEYTRVLFQETGNHYPVDLLVEV